MRFWGLMAVMWVVSFALVSGSQHVGRPASPPPRVASLLPQADCFSPCWQGIRPVMMGRPEIEQRLAALPSAVKREDYLWEFTPQVGYTHQIWFLEGITLTPQGVRLGDWLIHLGKPDYQTLQTAERISTHQTEMLVRLFYQQEQVIVVAALPLGGRLSPQTPLVALNYGGRYFARPFYSYDWFGLIWLEAYPPLVGS